MAHDVFISHSSKDKAIADAICANLESTGIRCWIAPRDIGYGEDWPTAIAQGISQSRIMVLIFSANSNSSDQISRELSLAADSKSIIIPFKIDNVVPEPGKQYYLARTHWLDAMNPPTQEQIKSLVERVRAILASISKPGVPQGGLTSQPKSSNQMLMAQRRKRLFLSFLLIAAVVIGLVLAAALYIAAIGSTKPVPAPMATLRSGVLFEDDFSSRQASRANGWTLGPSSDGVIDRIWSANKYTLIVKKLEWLWYQVPNGTYDDFGAEIEAQPNGAVGEYGIVFRRSVNPAGLDSYYVFGVTSDGKYRLGKHIDDKWAAGSLIPAIASLYVNPGQAKNRLGVLAKGQTLSFYINGTLVNTFNDTSLTQGSIGFYVASYDSDRAEVAFNRLTIFTVEQAKVEWGYAVPTPAAARTSDAPKVSSPDSEGSATRLIVTHYPNPARFQVGGISGSPYTCQYTTSVKASGGGIRIEEFGMYFWQNGEWVRSTSNNGKPWSAEHFAKWYSCPGAYIQAGKECSDPSNWNGSASRGSASGKWYYQGVDDNGKQVQAEAIIECQAP